MTTLKSIWRYLIHPSPWHRARREHMKLTPWSKQSALRLMLTKEESCETK
jgi:hypothetical protein